MVPPHDQQAMRTTYQLNEGLGDWIFKQIDDFIDVPKPTSTDVTRSRANAPTDLPPDVSEKMVAQFLKMKAAEQAVINAANAQKTTVEKITPYLTYFARAFVDRWNRIPQRDRANALKNLMTSLFRFLLFVLEAMVKSKR